jgi:hypothetical protein
MQLGYSGRSLNRINLMTGNQMSTAETKPSIIQRLPFTPSINLPQQIELVLSRELQLHQCDDATSSLIAMIPTSQHKSGPGIGEKRTAKGAPANSCDTSYASLRFRGFSSEFECSGNMKSQLSIAFNSHFRHHS